MHQATLAILNAKVMTLNPKQSTAQAIAVQNDRIVAVGSNRQVQKCITKRTIVFSARGKAVVPGLTDCHVHMTGFGIQMSNVELRTAKSIKEVQKRLNEFAVKHPERAWIIGRGFDEERFREKRLPTRWDIDRAVKGKPVLLTRVCGHLSVANTKALQLAGIIKKTIIPNGIVELDEQTHEPNGVLRENAMNLVWQAIPKPSRQELEQTCMAACAKAAEAGLTCVHWIIGSADEILVLQRLYSQGRLPIRVVLGIPVECLDQMLDIGLSSGFGNALLKVGFVKILADGSLGGHTAALKEPYCDQPQTCGMMLYTQEELDTLILKAHLNGLQVAVHAIGDHAVEMVLRAYEKVLKQNPVSHRHRMEHCSVLSPKLIWKMKELGIIASVQPHFVHSDFWVNARVGRTRARWVYPFRTLIHEGIKVIAGSDSPVEPISPILGIWAATAREAFPEENLILDEALQGYTINAAYASFDEDERGTIEPGKLADFTVLSRDPAGIGPNRIKTIKIEMTVVGGKIVFTR